ncbi:MAG: SDR family NAD(P)-dependent oxidoreductase [Aquabacterium sp.]|uniref:SDR family NAD(P)-dependent oxidoreductase n=1 Tax=Aquabacterium sp. TaxID=1872578 RepID=UPI0027221A1B|nr:SDR family NAD(P)-dependent oxidoreductase [Aquabacterium sp.]MDO9003247.1 SDR family NAD(P)-dependent oxidoreductase [Aquabacterium sp.]
MQVDASDSEGFAFTARLSGQEFFLADHVVKGQRVLPAAAHLEMAHAGVQRILGPIIPQGVQAGVTLTCVVFASAAVADGTLNLKMTLAPDHRAGIGFEIHGHSKTGPAMLLSQGRATVASQRPPPRCDVNAIRLGATLRTLRVEQCYQAFSAMGLDYGRGHRTIDHIEAGTDAQGRPIAMAQLVLPHSLKAGHGAFVLHPGLLDGALQAGLSLVFEAKGADAYGGGLCLPYAIDQVEIFGPLPERAQAIARIDHDEGHATSCRLSIEVVTTEGDVRVRVQGLSVRLLNIGAEATDASRAEALTLVPCWRPFTPDMRPQPSGLDVRRVIVHAQDDEASCANLRHHHPGATLVGVSCADETPHLTQALDRCGDIAELVWIPGVAGAASATLGFRLIKALLALGYEARPLSLTVVTTQGQAIGADEAIRPDHAALHGLVGSLAKEFVQWRIRLVDVAEGDVPPWSCIASLPPDESGHPMLYRFGQWYESRTTRVKLPDLVKPSGFRRGGVYVLLGGAGGLGEVLTKHLVQHHAAQVVWVGRRPEDEGIATRCDRIAVHGPRPHYVCADATDLPALQAAYRSIRTRFGAIHGVVHATIQLQDNSLARMDEASFGSVLSAKAQVCLNAAEVFAAETLDFVLFFSSVQSLAKLPGQANYAAGCTFADAHAHALAQARPDWRVKVVNWGYWGDVGIVASPVYRQRMAQAGIESIAADEGLALIEQLLSSPLRQVVYLKASKAVVAEQLGVLPEVGIRACELEVAAQPVSPGPSTLPIPVDPTEALAQSREFDRVLCGVLRAQLLASGLFEGGRIEADAWRKKPRSPALCDRWMAQSLRILQGQGAHVSDAWQAWESGLPRWRADPHRRAQVLLADACLRALPAILRGDVRSTDVIFPDSSMSLVEGIYKHNPVADYFNAVLGESLLSHMTACLEADPSATFRIAEIGAGTGGTSALMFDLLKPFAHVVQEYRYTDISKAFLLHAHQHYAQKAPYLATSLFNVALPLDGQDLAAGVYDVVIATNVLHATQDIRRTLRHAKALLKKGGCLLLNEIVGGSVFTHLTFGLMDGWWAYQDEALRCLGAPALSPQGWFRALQDEGFERISHPASLAHGLGQQVVVAFSDGLVQTSWSSASSTPSPSSPLSKAVVAPSLISD